MHGSVIATHFREWWLFGLFFVIVTPLQLAWAEAVRRRAQDRRLLAAGALGNGAVVAVWAVSRLVGLPFGPERFRAEPVGVKDVLASVDELALVALVVLLLARPSERFAWWLPALAWSFVAESVVAALVAGGH